MTDQRTPYQRFQDAFEERIAATCRLHQHVNVNHCPGCDQCGRIWAEYKASVGAYDTARQDLLAQ